MLHREKCDILQKDISFFGYRFSNNGIGPDKVKDTQYAPALSSVSGDRSFLGMVTNYGCFMLNMSDITGPLRELTKPSSPCVWDWSKKKL